MGGYLMLSFSVKLKELRKLNCATQKQIADSLGVREQTYQKYEYGQNEPNMETLVKLADYFDVSADYLLGRSDSPVHQ
ncbi:MAG: helix-turn-helix domain-containing protein [Treponema sp.]|nr:helix-turn-helix domain-containing protein [Treponema sp.]